MAMKSIEELMKETVEQAFEIIVNKALDENPMKDTPLEGVYILEVINNAAENNKRVLLQKAPILELTEAQVNTIVDETKMKISQKYLRM